MHEFRIPTHNRRYNRSAVGRLAFMVTVLVAVIAAVMYMLDALKDEATSASVKSEVYMPHPHKGEVYTKPSFALSYVEQYEIPEWVSYTLTKAMLNKPKFERNQDFNPDPSIRSGSAHYKDYKSSGYRRGHLVPAADMAWDKKAMDATFLLSNVAPMLQNFNDGIWLELEQNVRDWARRYGRIYVVTGPVFESEMPVIGANEIAVPRYYFKTIFTQKDQQPLVISFLLDQTLETYGPLHDYIVPVDSIEKLTGIDLFENLYGSWDQEIALEKQADVSSDQWPFNATWYQQRMDLKPSR